jgi:hypothetical protein
VVLYTRRYDTSIIVPRESCVNASVVLVQPVVVVVVILVSVVDTCIVVCSFCFVIGMRQVVCVDASNRVCNV